MLSEFSQHFLNTFLIFLGPFLHRSQQFFGVFLTLSKHIFYTFKSRLLSPHSQSCNFMLVISKMILGFLIINDFGLLWTKILETYLWSWAYFPDKAVVVNYIFFIVKFPQCKQNDLYECNKLSTDQPDVHQSHIGGRWQLLHHTSKSFYLKCQLPDLPYKERNEH